MSCGSACGDGSGDIDESLIHRCTWSAYLGQDEFGNNEYEEFTDTPCYVIAKNVSFAPNDTQDRWRRGPSNGYQLLFGNLSKTLVTGTTRSILPDDLIIVGDDTATVTTIAVTLDDSLVPLMLTVDATTEREV